MTNNNEMWLRKQATAFIASKRDDTALFNLLDDVIKACKNRGLEHADFSNMIKRVNNEKL